jgi:hypothetical protein
MMNRRNALTALLAAPVAAGELLRTVPSWAGEVEPARFQLATFSADITPPVGSPLCGGWITPGRLVDDPLRALGVVLLGADKPIVLCALDWVETNNSAYDYWRVALAHAAGTDESHVAVQCVHPHDTPWANLEAHKLVQAADKRLQLMHPESFYAAVEGTAKALRNSLTRLTPITHVGCGESRVNEVASARRVLGADGKVQFSRTSTCRDPLARECPEGLIDPELKTVSFWKDATPVAALHYYATHPMSRYGNGRVSSDFCGLARDRRQDETPGTFNIYFTGCAGDVTAGKYNDGADGMRQILTDRMNAAMATAWSETKVEPLTSLSWYVDSVTFGPRPEPEFAPSALRATLKDSSSPAFPRLRAAIILSWLDRIDKPVEISRLQCGRINLVHLPGEPFVQYQLLAQQQRPAEVVCVAGYGDGGMGYIPLKQSFVEGGYEPTMAFVSDRCEADLTQAMTRVLAKT